MPGAKRVTLPPATCGGAGNLRFDPVEHDGRSLAPHLQAVLWEVQRLTALVPAWTASVFVQTVPSDITVK